MGDLTAAVRVEHLSFGYGKRMVLDDVSLEIPRQGFTAVLGKNGSGKSTLLRVLAGLAPCREGRIELLGKDLSRLTDAERANLIGFLPQQHRPVFPFSVEDVVLTGRAGHVSLMPGKEDRRKALDALERTGLLQLRERIFTELSGGEQQMVLIARVLAQEPRIVLFDEPTSHLDFSNQNRLLDLIRRLVHSGLTIVAVLHDPNIAFLHGDHFIFLKAGRLLSPAGLRKPWDGPFLESLYDTRFHVVPYRDRALVAPGDV